jgi:hypothetical protein
LTLNRQRLTLSTAAAKLNSSLKLIGFTNQALTNDYDNMEKRLSDSGFAQQENVRVSGSGLSEDQELSTLGRSRLDLIRSLQELSHRSSKQCSGTKEAFVSHGMGKRRKNGRMNLFFAGDLETFGNEISPKLIASFKAHNILPQVCVSKTCYGTFCFGP